MNKNTKLRSVHHKLGGIGAIQKIRDTERGRGGSQSVTKYHKGGRGGWPECHMTIFCDFLTLNLPVLTGCGRQKSNFREN